MFIKLADAAKLFLLLLMGISCSSSHKERFDILSYTPPEDFKKETKDGVVTWSNVNKTAGTFCVIAIYPSSASTGNAQKDFDNAWNELVVTPFGAEPGPATETESTTEGWQLVTGAAPIKMDGIDCTIMLNVVSGFGKTISFRTSLNDQSYSAKIDALFESMDLDKSGSTSTNKDNTETAQTGNEEGNDNTATIQTGSGTGKFGTMMYSKPAGWSEQLFSNGVLFKPLDIAEKEYLSIQLMEPLNATGSLEQALAQSYDEAVVLYKCIYPSKYSKNPSQKSYNGWEYIRGHGGNMIPDGSQFGARYGLELFVIKINDRFERVAILESNTYCNGQLTYYSSDRRNYRNAIEHLLFSLHFTDFNGSVLSPGSVKAVWQGTMQSTSTSAVRLEVFSPVFLSNGQVYLGSKFPQEGLNGINTRLPPQLNNRDWGTYTLSNGSGMVHMPYADIPFRMQGNELVFTKNQTDWPFVQLPSVDGATFSGTYTMSAVNGVIPTISFTSDGSFTDNGALKELYHEYNVCLNPAITPGSGRYAVKDYSIVFNYTDGRKIALAFLGAEYDKSNPAPPALLMSSSENLLTRQ